MTCPSPIRKISEFFLTARIVVPCHRLEGLEPGAPELWSEKYLFERLLRRHFDFDMFLKFIMRAADLRFLK